VATVANVAVALRAAGWGGWGIPSTTWAVLVLGALAALGLAILKNRSDPVFALVLAWAAVAIAVAHWSVPTVAATALVVACVMFVGAAAAGVRGVARRPSA
jgi:translocator protein